MNIGDLFWTFRGDGARLQADAKKEGAKAGATLGQTIQANIRKSMSQAFTGANIGKGLVQGLGLAGGLGIANAVGKVVDILGDAVQAAREDQASIAALGGALRDQIKDFDGNTDAIERTIKARQRLGFTDEEQRLSLQRLLPVYKDVNKALEVQRAAMDLARFKRIDLAEATTSLITIEGGQYRGLKQLIGSTKDITNSTEALAAVRRAAGDAAEDLAATDEGKLLAAQIRQGEALEKLGYIIMPAYTAATETAASVAEDLAGNLDGLTEAARIAEPVLKALGVSTGEAADSGFDLIHAGQDLLAVMNPTKVSNTLGVLLDTMDHLGINTQAARTQLGLMGDDAESVGPRMTGTANQVGKAADDITGSTEDMADAATDWRDEYRDATGDIIRASHRVRAALVKDAATIRGEVFDETEIRASLHDQRLALFELKQKLRDAEAIKDAKKRKEAIRQASDDIIQALDDQGESLEDLADQGKLTQKDVDRFTDDAKASYSSLSKDGRAKLQALIAKYQALVDMPNVKKKFTVQTLVTGGVTAADLHKILTGRGSGTHPGGGGPQEFAEGGYRPPGVASWVGERGRELSIPTEGSFILPHDLSEKVAAMASVGGGGGGDTIQVNMLDRMPVTSVQDIGDRLRMLEQRGYLRRRIR